MASTSRLLRSKHQRRASSAELLTYPRLEGQAGATSAFPQLKGARLGLDRFLSFNIYTRRSVIRRSTDPPQAADKQTTHRFIEQN